MRSEVGTRQHSIPQFYQRGFITDGTGLIWVYEKNSEPQRMSVRNTAMEIDFYAFTKNNEFDNKTIEKGLEKIDSVGARLIHKLERGQTLTEQERYKLSGFVSVMWRRTAKHKKEAEQSAAGLMPDFFKQHDEDWLINELEKHGVAPGLSEVPFEEERIRLEKVRSEYLDRVPNFLFPRSVIRDSIFERVHFAMDWTFFKSTDDTEFLTSDNPVVFNKGTGLKDEKAVIFFPLSRKLCLQAMWISQNRGKFIQLDDLTTRTINRYVVRNADKQVYATYKSRVLKDFVSKWINTFDSK
jgi:hypothetical protein